MSKIWPAEISRIFWPEKRKLISIGSWYTVVSGYGGYEKLHFYLLWNEKTKKNKKTLFSYSKEAPWHHAADCGIWRNMKRWRFSHFKQNKGNQETLQPSDGFLGFYGGQHSSNEWAVWTQIKLVRKYGEILFLQDLERLKMEMLPGNVSPADGSLNWWLKLKNQPATTNMDSKIVIHSFVKSLYEVYFL